MSSYRIARRALLSGLGGAIGLEILLRNLEAAAEGASSPPRFLMAHWPLGTIRHHFLPSQAGTNFEISRILSPFEVAGLREDMIVLYGLEPAVRPIHGGGSESGTVITTTGVGTLGTRVNGGENDDGIAGGPSFDQILLKNARSLQRLGSGFANAICDAQVDSFETSSQCLSYSHERQEVESHQNGIVNEAKPLMPTLVPADLYDELFGQFIPGATPGAARRALLQRKSVLDSALRELDRIRVVAPAGQREKIDFHEDAIRQLEQTLSKQIAGCLPPLEAPDPAIHGKTGSRNDYGNPKAAQADDPMLEQTGKLHLSILRAAFQCDLIRVATFQWAPGTNHIAFQGLYPEDPAGAYMHNPLSHRVGNTAITNGPPPTDASMASIYEFLTAVHTWFNQKTADALVEFKTARDAFGNSLLDYTVVPFITECAEATNTRGPAPALILGGKKLGFIGGQYQLLSRRQLNDFWLTIAQAFFPSGTSLTEALASELFIQNTGYYTGPIAGLWSAPTP